MAEKDTTDYNMKGHSEIAKLSEPANKPGVPGGMC